MLKHLSIESYIDKNDISEEENVRIYNLVDSGHASFKNFDDVSIIYESDNQEEIEKYLRIDIGNNSKLLKDVLGDHYDGGESIMISNSEFSINECIVKLKEKLEFYSNRILKSNDSYEEIAKILKEQMVIVFTEFLDEGYKLINNGKFSWE